VSRFCSARTAGPLSPSENIDDGLGGVVALVGTVVVVLVTSVVVVVLVPPRVVDVAADWELVGGMPLIAPHAGIATTHSTLASVTSSWVTRRPFTHQSSG
jgi:hypothetical protein